MTWRSSSEFRVGMIRSSLLAAPLRSWALVGGALLGTFAVARPAAAQIVAPVLDFPEAGIDDSVAYQGYRTRFFRDSKGNTVQIYLDARSGRVVNLWADAANESVGFTVRSAGSPAILRWASPNAVATDSGRFRLLRYRLTSDSARVELGWFVLGSMRVERDVQYAQQHLRPFADRGYVEPVLATLIGSLARLPEPERSRHLALLQARDTTELHARLEPTIRADSSDSVTTISITQPSFDARHRLTLDVLVDSRQITEQIVGPTIRLVAKDESPVAFEVRISTDGEPLTPLSRAEIFDPRFLAFADSMRRVDPRMERQIRGVELLSSREKLMAGLPNYATYFGRDQLMSALMMERVWTSAMAEHVIGSVLRKLSPRGDVSHEEALGGQAIREAASEYMALLASWQTLSSRGDQQRADSILARARTVLEHLDQVRENYAMIDDEFQLPVLVSHYLRDPRLDDAHKRDFLRGSEQGRTRLELLMRELEVVAASARPYAMSPVATNLVSFARLDSAHWRSGSWRDSRAGYANGRFAMDVNAVWVPVALQSIQELLAALRQLQLLGADSSLAGAGPLVRQYVHDAAPLRRARSTWAGASRHFIVRLTPAQIREHVRAKLASLPTDERQYWERVVATTRADSMPLEFVALSLDASGRPIGVANTDPATRLFLTGPAADRRAQAGTLRDVRVFMRPYPVGLYVDSLGPVVANDAYASPSVWEAFSRDLYHSPRVVWGREVNLFLLGVANQVGAALDGAPRGRADAAHQAYVRTLQTALRRTQAAVDASGLRHNELWSYRITAGHLQPIRYGASTDVQLWNTTSLAVQFALAQLAERERRAGMSGR